MRLVAQSDGRLQFVVLFGYRSSLDDDSGHVVEVVADEELAAAAAGH